MGFVPFFSFLAFLLPFIFAPSAYSFCSTAICPNNTLTPVQFPFHLDKQRTANCSYPGFNLHCTDQGHTAITLPHAGEFLVRQINYETQYLLLDDTDNCLPRRLLEGFDPSGSPFQADFFLNFTFLRCPRNFTDARYDVIDCLSNSTRTVIATSRQDIADEVSRTCEVMRELQVPVIMSEDGSFTSSLSDNIWLSWFVPDCKDCEARGGICGFQSNGNRQVGCVTNLSNSGNKNSLFQTIDFFKALGS